MIFVGTPYGQNPQLMGAEGIGGSPYGPGTVTGPDGSRQPAEVELATARNLGRRITHLAGLLKELRRNVANKQR
jgi:NAD(P)H dehydrogenase (quinone)